MSAVVLSSASAAGLGKLTVLSSLGQPLRAEIELNSVSPDEAGLLVPKLASVEAFQQAKIDLIPALFSLRFAVEQRGTQQFIRITSTQPINEPFVDMLLELGGNKGRLVREYTFLLDPPEMRSPQATQVAPVISSQPLPPAVQQPASKPEPASEPIRENPPSRTPAAKSQRTASTPKPETQSSDEYHVKKGDSLAKIANQYRPSGVSLDQMLVALYRANPDAFISKNMNRLRAGQILSVPDSDTSKSVNQSEAKGVVVAQAADFNSYRSKLAGQVVTAEPKKSEDVKQTAAGKITTRIQDGSAAASESKDKLKLSKSGAASATGSDKALPPGASTEEIIAKDKAIAEANARVKELEKNVGELQKILEIKNKDMAEQQKQAKAGQPTPVVAPAPVAPAATPAPVVTATTAASTVAVATPAVVAAEMTPAPAPAATAPVIPPVAVKPKHPVLAPPPASSFFEDLTGNALFLPGAAALLALLAGLGIYSSRRRKQPKSFDDSIITDSSLKSNSLFGSTGGQSVDTNNSVFNSNFVPSASQLDTNEVDPIAEADVYIAYGRDAQAEEILKEALRNQPDRHAVRVKLLEIYANRNDVRSFEILASELYSMTKGEGDDWRQAANLGLMLDPSNPLYASGTVPEAVVSRATALTAPTQPLDGQNLGDLLAATESGASLEASPYFGNTTLLTAEALSQKPVAPIEAEKMTAVEDLDFDLEGIDVESPAKKSPAPTAPVKSEMPADIASIDFDFLADKSAIPAVVKPGVAVSFSPTEKESPTPALHMPIAESVNMDFLSKDFEHPASAANPPAKFPEFDLSDIALDLSPSATPSADPEALSALGNLLDQGNYSSNAEMATKLDLAIAYQEIGDKEGARELLEEVISSGNSEQSEKATNLLNKLS